MDNLATTNIWLAILAIVSLLEFLMICAAGLFAYKAYRQAMSIVEMQEPEDLVIAGTEVNP